MDRVKRDICIHLSRLKLSSKLKPLKLLDIFCQTSVDFTSVVQVMGNIRFIGQLLVKRTTREAPSSDVFRLRQFAGNQT